MWAFAQKAVRWFWNRRLRFVLLVAAVYALFHYPISSYEPYEVCGKHHPSDRFSVFYLQQVTGFLAERNVPFYVKDQKIYMTLDAQDQANETVEMYPKYVEHQMFDPSNPDYPAYPNAWIVLHQKRKELSAASLKHYAATGDTSRDLDLAADDALCDLIHSIVTQGKDRQKIWLPSEQNTGGGVAPNERSR